MGLALAGAVAISDCAPHPAPPQRPRAARTPIWVYDVRVEAEAVVGGGARLALAVDGVFAPGGSDSLGLDDAGAPFVHDVEYSVATGAFRPAERRGTHWMAPCHIAGCHVRYRFGLTQAAAALDDPTTAGSAGGVVVAPPSTWLLRPLLAADDSGSDRPFRFRVRTDAGVRFASGAAPAPGGAPDEFEAIANTLEDASFAVFGDFRVGIVRNGASRVDVVIAPRGLTLADAAVVAWVERAVASLADYYGRFAVRRTLVIVVPGKHGNTNGVTLGEGGPSILLRAAPGLSPDATRDDWVLTHELVHVTLPSFGREHAWLEEGIATYVEPIARARAGLVTAERYWHDLVEGIPKGLPEAGDEGLERTHTWGRTYWGGALFCLVADVRIRERTRNARSFDDVLRGVVATGADVGTNWLVEQFLGAGDRATQTGVLAELYREMAFAPVTVDLAALWSRLGVVARGGVVSFDEGAPLASVRRAMTAPTARSD